MRKFMKAKFLPYYTLIACFLGFLLRLWTLGGGPDQEGLYQPQTPAWVLLWILTAGLAATIIYLTRRLDAPGRYADNFPASPVGAIGSFAGAVGIMISSLKILSARPAGLDMVTGILGIVSAVMLLMTGLNRLTGKRNGFLFHSLPCLFFALRIFSACREWSTEPQISTFIFPFLASISIMLANYQRASFDVNLGKRRHSLFWSLMGTYFCCLSLPLCDDVLFYITMAAWLMTNLCSLRPMKKKAAPAAEPVPETPRPAPEPTPEPTAPATEESIDDIIAWLDDHS